MRACFLGQNICALGYGVALVQSPPMEEASESRPEDKPQMPPAETLPENRMLRDLRRRHIPFS
jgi:hypothetical protein